MLCQICKERSATIHLTEINSGQRCESHMCQQCAQQQGLSIQSQVPLNELMDTLLSSQKQKSLETSGNTADQAPSHACPDCGMTLQQFAQTPLLGCANDYQEFHDELMPLIEQSHNGKSCHCGKIPSHVSDHDRNEIELNKLRRQLEQAVREEDYETAAKLRDQIQAYS